MWPGATRQVIFHTDCISLYEAEPPNIDLWPVVAIGGASSGLGGGASVAGHGPAGDPLPPAASHPPLPAGRQSSCQEPKSLWNIRIYKSFYEILWNYMEFHGMLKHSVEIHPISMEC